MIGADLELIAFGQVLLAAVLGMTLGAERTIAGKMAGMRTYGLVAMGACLLIVTSAIVNQRFIGLTNFDPLRLAAGVVTGIGFIGAGLIILKENKVDGLTTAAGLWVAAAIGIAVGFKLFTLSLLVTFSALLVFTLIWFVEDKLKKKMQKSEWLREHNQSTE